MNGTIATPEGLLGYRLSVCGILELDEYLVDKTEQATAPAQPATHMLSILSPQIDYSDDFEDLVLPGTTMKIRFEDVLRYDDAQTVPPSMRSIMTILQFGELMQREEAVDGGQKHLLMHCDAGRSRSAAAAAILMAQYCPGQERSAFTALETIRDFTWPNSLMIRLADEKMGRGGAFIDAWKEHCETMFCKYPHNAEFMHEQGLEAVSANAWQQYCSARTRSPILPPIELERGLEACSAAQRIKGKGVPEGSSREAHAIRRAIHTLTR